MSFLNYFNKVLCIFAFLSFFGLSQTSHQNVASIAELPFCETNKLSEVNTRLILVSTLDGKMSALNVDNGGSEAWNVQTGPGAMLSSSIHRLELTNNGQWVRMIPSLSGGLYKFNGEHIEAIPITADNLLRSSFRYSDDLVISGGKESRTYGVDIESGRVLYECSLGGCDNYTELEAAGDVVLVQRQTQTVRAVEPRTGQERWNFSVGQHEVKVSPGPLSGCYPSSDPPDMVLKVIVPEGLVCAVSKSRPSHVLWTHKFDAPVVGAWRVSQGQLQDVDLFSGTQMPAVGPDEEPLPSSPVLYVGMHQKQLYIQESVSMQHHLYELATNFQQHLLADERGRLPQIPWNPVPASSTVLGLAGPEQVLSTDSTSEENNQTTAIAVLYASEYVNGNGYYLYDTRQSVGAEARDTTLCPANDTHNDTEEDVPSVESPDLVVHNHIFVVSLWFWWKEVFLISVTSAVLLNMLWSRRGFSSQVLQPTQFFVVSKVSGSRSSQDSGRMTSESLSTPSLRAQESFESRFLTDFIPVHCLGKGGFGVVFEAKNKIDDCHYAIKRIPLPNSEESRERVMREVKALAKLDHQNIVRYFNAWLECPPPGWQEGQDQTWQNNRDALSSVGDAFTVDLTGAMTPESERSAGHIINRNRLKPHSRWTSPDWPSQSMPSRPVEDDNDSFIVFGSPNPSREVSQAVSRTEDILEEIRDEEVDEKLDSAIMVASDTSCDTNTNVTDVEATDSLRRPNKLTLRTDLKVQASSRMFLFIQMQLCKKKSLRDWLKDNTYDRPRMEVLNIFEQIVRAVEYVHMQGLIHRDLKPSNIFFSPDGQVKVGDFGLVTAMAESPVDIWVSVETELSSWAEDKHTARVGTQLYMSPEQVTGRPYSYKVDIYSLGVILFELLVPFNTQMERIHTLTNLRANKFPDDFQSKFCEEYDLLRLMLSPQPDERPTTFGIRARSPLGDPPNTPSSADWHFELPSRRRSSTSISQSSSVES